MKYLAIDTTASKLTVVLFDGIREIDKVLETQNKRHNSALLPLIEEIVNEADMTISDIDYLGVVVGPGSFTGIRVGIATVNAIAAALGKKVVSMTSLEGAFVESGDVLALLDCKHNNYYAAIKDGENISYHAITGDEIPSFSLTPAYLTQYEPKLIHTLMKSKISIGNFSDKASAFYIKKSSAERISV